jgi:hypothetical protein
MVHPGRAFGRKILKERPAHGYIDQLNSPADPEDRESTLACHGKQGELEEIPLLAGRTEMRRGRAAIPGGLYVFAAGQNESMHPIESCPRQGCTHHRREDQRDPSRPQNGPHICGIDSGTVGSVPTAHYSTDGDPWKGH